MRKVIGGFGAGQRIHVPVSITGNTVEYFLPVLLAGVAVDTIDVAPAATAKTALVAPWLIDAARLGSGDSTVFRAGGETAHAIAMLSQEPIRAERLRAAHAMLMCRPAPSRFRDAIAWVDGHSPRHATLVPPPSSAIEPLVDDLCAFLARADVPTWIKQALAYYQFVHIHPFGDGNGRMSRVLVAALGGQSRLPGTLVALALCLHRKAATRLFIAMRAGESGEYMTRWRQLDEWAHRYAIEVVALEDALRRELVGLVGTNSGPRLFDMLAGGRPLSVGNIAEVLRWSSKNAPRHFERLREAGWIDGPDDTLSAPRLRANQRLLVSEVESSTASIIA